ncbi:MAG TPA: hypothetical protein VFQ78_09085, partial [Candidatus Udaeobacter sp.]|nr:hypothetical protein [Candidatus Udaeobacter sp.]
IVVAFLVAPVLSFAQSSRSPEMSIEDLIFADIADDSIEVLSTDETDIPGYTHQEPGFRCLGEWRLVDYYGSVFDPKDQKILRFEPMKCSPQHYDGY